MNTVGRILIAFGLVLAAMVPRASAMNGDTAMMKPTHEFRYVSPGYSWADLGKVNAFLNSEGLAGFSDQAWTIALGGYRDYHRFIMESALSARIWGSNLTGSLRVSLFAGDLTWNTGFNVLPPEWSTSVYPYLGLGVGLNDLYFRANSRSLGSLLSSVDSNFSAWELTPLLNLGIGSNFLLPNKDGTKGLAIGLRVGYLVDLYTSKRWYSDGIYVNNLPSILQSGPYIRLIIGGWGSHHMHHHHDEA